MKVQSPASVRCPPPNGFGVIDALDDILSIEPSLERGPYDVSAISDFYSQNVLLERKWRRFSTLFSSKKKTNKFKPKSYVMITKIFWMNWRYIHV